MAKPAARRGIMFGTDDYIIEFDGEPGWLKVDGSGRKWRAAPSADPDNPSEWVPVEDSPARPLP